MFSVELKQVETERHVQHGARSDRKLEMVNGVTRISERQLSFYWWQVSQVLLRSTMDTARLNYKKKKSEIGLRTSLDKHVTGLCREAPRPKSFALC